MKKKRSMSLKKPVFRTMFLKRFLLLALIAGCIGFLGTYVTIHLYGWYIESDSYNSMEYFLNDVERDYEQCGGNLEQFQELVSFDTSFTTSIGSSMYVLLDRETGDIVAQPRKDTMYILASSGMDEEEGAYERQEIYRCSSKEIIDTIEQARLDTNYSSSALYLKMDDYYEKDYMFVPGKVRIMTYGGFDGIILKELDFTPRDTTGFQHIIIAEDTKRDYSDPIIFGNDVPEELLQYMNEIIEEKEWWKAGDDITYDNGRDIGSIGDNSSYSYNWIEFEESEDSSYAVLWVMHYNFFEIWKWDLLLAYGILFLVTLVISWFASYISYTKQKNYYEMDQYRRDMTNTMAHDLKSPLMIISGFAENLLEQNLDDKSKHFTKSIVENVDYMNRLIEKTLELSKVENADYKLHKEAIDLREVTNELVKRYTSQLEMRGLEVQIFGECTVNADKICMTEVLDNLISNAIKYAIEGSVIEVCLEKRCYEISNASAVDFDMDVQNLLKPFVKGDNSRSGKNGSGIGLTIAKNLCEQHGYKLNVEYNDGTFVAKIEV